MEGLQQDNSGAGKSTPVQTSPHPILNQPGAEKPVVHEKLEIFEEFSIMELKGGVEGRGALIRRSRWNMLYSIPLVGGGDM